MRFIQNHVFAFSSRTQLRIQDSTMLCRIEYFLLPKARFDQTGYEWSWPARPELQSCIGHIASRSRTMRLAYFKDEMIMIQQGATGMNV